MKKKNPNNLAFDSAQTSVGYLECEYNMWCMTHTGKNSGVVHEQS